MDFTAARVFRFSTDQFPEHKRVDAYREIYGGTIIKHDLELIGEEPFRFDATLCSFSGLGLVSSLISPCRRWHGPQHVNSDDLVLGVGVSGGCIVQHRGREAVIGQGEAVLTSCADPGLVIIQNTSRPISLRLPRSSLAARIVGIDSAIARTIWRSAPVKLLTGYVGAIWQSGVATMDPVLSDMIAAHIEDLVCLVLGAGGETRELADKRGGRAARLSAILCAIEDSSAEPGLSAAAIAGLLGVTPRYVHLLLEETGKSFTHHVLERRLDKAAALLRDRRWNERRIAELAGEVGFTDLSYFSRAFRRRFGATPSDVRRAANKNGD